MWSAHDAASPQTAGKLAIADYYWLGKGRD